jgi:hypothetical protein
MTSEGATIDVGAWLRGLGLGEYEATFRENAIDDTVLPNVTAEDLKDLGVGIVGHRRKLLDAIAALRTGADAKAPTPSSTPLPRAPVAAASTQEAAGERRHVTVLFCDLVDSTGIAAKLDAEEWRDLVGAYLDAASTAVTEMGGKVISARSLRGKVESGERRCSLRSALKFKEKRDTSSLMRRMR